MHAPITSEQTHALASKSQSAHVPLSGPVASPLVHVLVDAHQPQPASAAQSPQVPYSAHGSGAAHSLGSHDQSPVHEPVDGPDEVPASHAPSHHPHG